MTTVLSLSRHFLKLSCVLFSFTCSSPAFLFFVSNWISWTEWYTRVVLVVMNPPASAGDIRDSGLIPGLEKSPGGGNGNPSSILAWRIPWTKESGGLQSTGSTKSQTLLKQISTHTYKLSFGLYFSDVSFLCSYISNLSVILCSKRN